MTSREFSDDHLTNAPEPVQPVSGAEPQDAEEARVRRFHQPSPWPINTVEEEALKSSEFRALAESRPKSLFYCVQIPLDDCDADGYLRLDSLIDLAQDLDDRHGHRLGVDYAMRDAVGVFWMVVSYDFVFPRERPHMGEVMLLETWLERNQGVRYLRENQYYDRQGRPWGGASGDWLLASWQDRMPVRPQDVQERSGHAPLLFAPELSGRPSLRNEKGRVPRTRLRRSAERPAAAPILTYKVLSQDLDSNRHMHNTKYLALALSALEAHEECRPGESRLRIARVRMTFLHEVFVHQELEYTIAEEEEIPAPSYLEDEAAAAGEGANQAAADALGPWRVTRVEAWLKDSPEQVFLAEFTTRKEVVSD